MCAERTAAADGRRLKKVAAAMADIEIGKRVRHARLSRGMSQMALGFEVGITFQQIQKYENGSNRVSVSMMLKIAEALNVPVIQLMEGLDAGGEPLPVISDPYALRAAALVTSLSAPQRAKVVAMLETFVAPAGDGFTVASTGEYIARQPASEGRAVA